MKPSPTTEDLLETYKKAGEAEQKLIRDLVKAGKGEEAKRLIELLYYFPGAHLQR